MSRRRGRKQAGANALGAVLIGVVALALGGFVYAGFALRPPPTEADSLCLRSGAITAHTIILIDATDRLEARHRRKLEAVARQEQARLAQYDRLTLLRLDSRNPQEPRVLFSKCLPLPPDRANPFVQNPAQAQADWDASFANALESALRSAQSSGPNRASPILSGLRAVAADPEFGAEIASRRLVLVSDLLEHDPGGFTLYAEGATFAQWRASSPSPPPDLSNVTVRVVPLDRPDHAARQAQALERFWPDYFETTQAADFSIDPAP